jgi:hypothetical protein
VEDYPLLDGALQAIGAGTPDLVSIEVIHNGKRVAGYRQGDPEPDVRHFSSDISLPANADQPGTKLGVVRLQLSERHNRALMAQHLYEAQISIGLAFLVLFAVLGGILRGLVLRRIAALTHFAEDISSTHGSPGQAQP